MSSINNKGYTKVDNWIFETLYHSSLTALEIKVYLFVIRFTSGFQRNDAELSYSFIAEGVGISRRRAISTVKKLSEKNMISIKRGSGVKPNRITLVVTKRSHTSDGQVTIASDKQVTTTSDGQVTEDSKAEIKLINKKEERVFSDSDDDENGDWFDRMFGGED